MISLGADSGRHDSSQEIFSYLLFVTVDHVVHPPQEVANGHEIWWPHGPGLWTKTSTRYEGVQFPRGEINRESDSQGLSVKQYREDS